MSKSPREAGPEKVSDDGADAAIDRRSFLASGAAVGAVAALPAQPAQAADAIAWDHEVDVVVIGAGAGGLTSAIAAREKGASVLIVEKNFDIGGRAMMSFGGLYIGGGNRMQKAIGVDDSPDKVFADWSRPEKPMGRFSDRALVRTYADNNLELFDWLEKHGIKWDAYRPQARPARPLAHPAQCRAMAQRGHQSGARLGISCGRWRRPPGRWASRSCSSTR